MTTVDVPDWFEGAQQIGATPLVNESGVSHAAAFINYGPLNCGAFPYLLFFASSTSAAALEPNYNIQFYTDQALTNLVGRIQLYGFPTIDLWELVPVLGPWAKIVALYHQGAGNVTTSMVVTPVQRADNLMVFTGATPVHRVPSQVIAGGATATITPFYVTTGEALMVVTTDATAWQADLVALNNDSTVYAPLGRCGTTALPASNQVPVSLAQRAAQLTLKNNDGVNRTFSASVIPYRRM